MPAVLFKDGGLNAMTLIQTALKAGGDLNPAELRLFQNNLVITPNTPIGDLTEADFDGYAAEALTWLIGPYFNAQGQPEIQNASVNWTPTGSTTPNVVYGWYMVTSDGKLFYGQNFANPRPMASGTDSLTLLPTLILATGGLAANVDVLDV